MIESTEIKSRKDVDDWIAIAVREGRSVRDVRGFFDVNAKDPSLHAYALEEATRLLAG